ncbi:MAG: translation elongation factor Ts [Pseudomonadota bacterium]
MTAISAAQVKELREITGAGMMDCKKALTECAGDIEASVDWLRKKGLSKAAKKSDRVAAEGLVAVAVDGNKGVAIELNSETDFVAKNEQFQKLVSDVAQAALKNSASVEDLKNSALENGQTVSENITNAIASIGENMSLRRVADVSVDKGVVCAYVHNKSADNMGKIGVLVGIESEGDAAQIAPVAKQIAMHIAATNPAALSSDELDAQTVERERKVYQEQAEASGKPEKIIAGMVEGRMKKYFKEVCLLEQPFVMDPDRTVAQVVADLAKETGSDAVLKSFVMFKLGEGIQKEESDFAAEVAAAVGQ